MATDVLGGLTPTVLDMSPPARAAWVQAYDAIEFRPQDPCCSCSFGPQNAALTRSINRKNSKGVGAAKTHLIVAPRDTSVAQLAYTEQLLPAQSALREGFHTQPDVQRVGHVGRLTGMSHASPP